MSEPEAETAKQEPIEPAQPPPENRINPKPEEPSFPEIKFRLESYNSKFFGKAESTDGLEKRGDDAKE
jgi:hypothetical protein